MRTPCHPRKGSLHLAHADGSPYDIAHSTRGNPNGVDPDSLAAWDISHPDRRGRRFNFSDQTYSDPLIALTRRVFLSVYSAAEFF